MRNAPTSKDRMDSEKARFDRYEKLKSDRFRWTGLLEDSYSLALPNKNIFFDKTRGNERNLEIYDATAPLGLQAFASNLQSILMPPFQRWMSLIPGDDVPENQIEDVKKVLDEITRILFKFIDQSNLALQANESFQELGISTGIMMLEEGDDENPLRFRSVPLATVVFEEGPDGSIENFWRKLKIPVRQIPRIWEDAKLPKNMQEMLRTSPDEKVELIEGTILMHGNSPQNQYHYYIQDVESKQDIISEFREWSPWFGFRMGKMPGETLGRGPIINMLPFIRQVNKMSEFELRSNQFRAYPAYTAPSSNGINPWTLVLEPGSIVPIEPNFVGKQPIAPIPLGGDPNFSQLSIANMQQIIREGLFDNPLPAQTQNTTATEISIRQQNWIRRSTSSFGRLTTELLEPIIRKALLILNRKGLIPEIKLDNKEVSISYESPVFDIQKEDDVTRAQEWIQQLNTTFGQFGILGTKAEELPFWFADKLGVDLSLVQDKAILRQEIQELVSRLSAQLAPQQAEPPQPAGPAAPPVSVPAFQPGTVSPVESQVAQIVQQPTGT